MWRYRPVQTRSLVNACVKMNHRNVRKVVLIENNRVKTMTPADIETTRSSLEGASILVETQDRILLQSASLTHVLELILQMHHVVIATEFFSVHSKNAGHE